MSGLLGSILSTTNALQANQTAIEVAGKNMSNVNNTYYSRQRVEFGISGGISESTISQQRDAIIDDSILRESSVAGSLEAQSKIYQQLQLVLGEQITDDVTAVDTLEGSSSGDFSSSGLSSTIDDFFNSLHALSMDPDDLSIKASVIAQAEVMVNRFNSVSESLTEMDENVVDTIETEVDEVNQLLDEIASLNKEIARVEIIEPGSVYEFRDLRQQKLTELSGYMDFESTETDNGMIRITARDKDSGGGNEILLVDRAVVDNHIGYNEDSNELYFTGATDSDMGDSPNTDAFDIEGGSLHGYLYSRSTTDPYGDPGSYAIGPLAKMQEDLDTLAQEIATQFSAIYDTPGDNEFFFDDNNHPDAIDTTNITAANIQLYAGDPQGTYGTVISPLDVSTLKSTNSANTGANELALELAELSEFSSSNLKGTTFSGFVSNMATDIGYSLSSTNAQLESQELIMTQLEDQKASYSGVSIDEELANMIRYQRSFEAASRVLQVMDEMLEVITGLVR